jgi:hypothetical protein
MADFRARVQDDLEHLVLKVRMLLKGLLLATSGIIGALKKSNEL